MPSSSFKWQMICLDQHYLIGKIFSPDGFFAVRVKVFEKGYQVSRVWPIYDEAGEGLQVGISEDDTGAQVFEGQYYYPKDKPLDNIEAEITAFYEAVHAMKTMSEKVLNDEQGT